MLDPKDPKSKRWVVALVHLSQQFKTTLLPCIATNKTQNYQVFSSLSKLRPTKKSRKTKHAIHCWGSWARQVWSEPLPGPRASRLIQWSQWDIRAGGGAPVWRHDGHVELSSRVAGSCIVSRGLWRKAPGLLLFTALFWQQRSTKYVSRHDRIEANLLTLLWGSQTVERAQTDGRMDGWMGVCVDALKYLGYARKYGKFAKGRCSQACQGCAVLLWVLRNVMNARISFLTSPPEVCVDGPSMLIY